MTMQDRHFERFGWAVRLSPLAVAVILTGLWVAGGKPAVPDLRLSAPVVARPGTTVGLRAWQVDRDRDGYAVILAPEVVVELRNAAGDTVGRTELSESRVQGREGDLAVPDGPDQALFLVALGEIDGRVVSVERTLYVSGSIESRWSKGRTVNAFQVYELGPLRVVDPRRAPRVLDPRIEEGACVPGLRCWLSVWVGGQAVRVRARPLSGVRVESGVVRASKGFARLALVVEGQEGRVVVEAIGEDESVWAAREVRLPVIPGGIVARAVEDHGRVRVDWDRLGGLDDVLVDVFQGRRWVHALSLSRSDPRLSTVLGPGVWRLQVRADLFSDNTAGVSYVVVAEPDGPGRARQAADEVLAEAAREGLDPLAMTIVEGTSIDAPVAELEHALFAVPSFDVVSIGPAVSARTGLDEELEREQEVRRRWAAAAILLIGLIVSMVLLRIELAAQAHARRILEDLGDGLPVSRPDRSPGRGLWAFVLLVFVVMAVLALSKGWF